MRWAVRVAVTLMIVGAPACQCQITPDQIEAGEKCWDQLVKVATSEACLTQCLSANWVGCAMGCGMGLITEAFPDCSKALASLFTTPAPAGFTGAKVGPKELVCKPDAPAVCKQAEVRIRDAYDKAAK